MKLAHRFTLALTGLVLVALSVAQLRRGVFTFDNASYHQTTFAAAGIGTGLLIAALAFLPAKEEVYKRITTKRSLGKTHRRPRP